MVTRIVHCVLRALASVGPGSASGLIVTSIVLSLCALPGCSRTLPPRPTQAALYRDLQRLVTLAEAAGWGIDRYEIEAMLPTALMSVCQVPPEDAHALELWLDTRIAALGGPVDVAYEKRKRKLSRISTLLETVRIRDTLRAALMTASSDCPFWLRADEQFAGRQISDDRWQISLGGGGQGHLVRQGDINDIQFGGAGRALLGRNLGDRFSLYAGLEVGGSASVPKGADGDRTNLVVAVDLVAPVVLRYRLVNTFVELEGGYLARATEDDWRRISHGFHLGAAVGARTERVRWFFPGAVFGIGYDRVEDGGVLRNAVKLGVRVIVDIDL